MLAHHVLKVCFELLDTCQMVSCHRSPRRRLQTHAPQSAKEGGFPRIIPDSLGALHSKRDDFLDASAALWTANRIYDGVAKRLPQAEQAEFDGHGLDMAIWL